MTDKTQGDPNPTRVSAAANICGAIVLWANAILAVAQVRDNFGWDALGIMIFWGPIVNGTLLIVFLALTPLVKRMAHGASVGLYVAVAVVLPLAFVPCQFFLPWLHAVGGK